MKTTPASAPVPRGPHIPRIIHQTYRSWEALPEAVQANIHHIRQLNPGWDYRLYEDADIETFIRETYGSAMLELYQRIDPAYGAARADFFRYLLIYAQGGVYIDVKSAVTRPLDQVLQPDDRYILSHWDNRPGGKYVHWGMHDDLARFERGEYQQWHVIGVAGHPFLEAVIRQVIDNLLHYDSRVTGVGFMGVLRNTGPIAYTLAIEQVRHLHPYRQVEIEQDLGIEYSIYDAMSKDRQKNHRNLFARHYTELDIPLVRDTVA